MIPHLFKPGPRDISPTDGFMSNPNEGDPWQGGGTDVSRHTLSFQLGNKEIIMHI